MEITSKDFLRSRFEKINSYYGKKGLTPQLSVIRIEENLVNGQGVYNFNLKKENISGCEKNLKRNDLFVCIGIGIATRINDENKPNVSIPDFSPRLGVAEQKTDASSNVTDLIATEGFATKDIFAMYNGSLRITTGTTVNFEDMPAALFLKQQSDDYTQEKSSGNPFVAKQVRSKDFNLVNDIHILAEELTFAGTQDHQISLSFPTFATADYSALQSYYTPNGGTKSQTSNNTSKVIFYALGWRVLGGTQPEYQNDEKNPFKGCI